MRLWHQQLIKHLPRQQLLGQHRELCALRGAGWGRPHSVVNYVFKYDPSFLVAYHIFVMEEMRRRGYKPDLHWYSAEYRGTRLEYEEGWADQDLADETYHYADNGGLIYSEHNKDYLIECLDNLKAKGIDLYDKIVG